MEESPRARVEPETNTTLNTNEVRLESLIRDPGVRPPLSSYPSNQQDEIRRTYIRLGPYQLVKAHYPLSPCGFHKRRFQAAWFRRLWWLEYSDKKDAAFVSNVYLLVQEAIRDEIGTAKFCLIVDESQDESKKEQMAIVVRFVDRNGYIKERFLDLVHVKDTNALTLKNEILSSLSHLKLDVQDIRGQGYDGASNMRGEWNGLKAFCFERMSFCLLCSSTKRNDQLQDAQLAEISYLAEIGELEGGRGANQMQNIQRPGDTRWSSHFKSICSLVRLFGPTRVVLNDICIGRSTGPQKGDAKYALTHLLSFDFILVLHLMKKIMEITDKLCKFLQNKSQDIVNALTLVSTTKTLIQKLRDDGWQSLIDQVVCFCDKYNIPVPDMNATYRDIIQSRNKKDDVTVEHHYRVDVFIVAIDSLLQELNNRFNESVSELLRELLRLSVTLDPKKSFNADDICKLVTKYHPLDFTEQERIELRLELQHFELDSDPKLKNVSSLSALCRGLQETEKSECSFIA
ncbi:zinc finger MYM-type protein 1-like protein [Tanacetum coccineum]